MTTTTSRMRPPTRTAWRKIGDESTVPSRETRRSRSRVTARALRPVRATFVRAASTPKRVQSAPPAAGVAAATVVESAAGAWAGAGDGAAAPSPEPQPAAGTASAAAASRARRRHAGRVTTGSYPARAGPVLSSAEKAW